VDACHYEGWWVSCGVWYVVHTFITNIENWLDNVGGQHCTKYLKQPKRMVT